MSEIVTLKKIVHEGIPANDAIKKLEEITEYFYNQDIIFVIQSLETPAGRLNGLEISRANVTLVFQSLVDPIEFGTKITK